MASGNLATDCAQVQFGSTQTPAVAECAEPHIDIDIRLDSPVSQIFRCQLQVGQIAVLLAPSGAGKTSLFNGIAGLSSSQGKLLLAGQAQQHKAAHQRDIAYVSQSPLLFHHLKVAQLIELVRRQQAKPFAVDWALAPLALADKLQHYPAQLSGGQRQRLALLLAMLKGAPLLLLDEVLTGLDSQSKSACMAVICSYLQRANASVLMACHQLEDAIALADSALVCQPEASGVTWQAYPISSGVFAYQQRLLQSASDSLDNPPECQASQFVSLLQLALVKSHLALGLTEYQVAGQHCYGVYQESLSAGQQVAVSLQANRLGLAKNRLPQSSFVNQLKVEIKAFQPVSCNGEQGMLIEVELVNQDDTQVKQNGKIAIWITRLSFNQLQPNIADYYYLIAKADAFQLVR